MINSSHPDYEINIRVAQAIGLNPHCGNKDNYWGVGVGHFMSEDSDLWYAKYKPEQYGFNLMLGERGKDHECTYPIPDFCNNKQAAVTALETLLNNKSLMLLLNFSHKEWQVSWKKFSDNSWNNTNEYPGLSFAICEAILKI